MVNGPGAVNGGTVDEGVRCMMVYGETAKVCCEVGDGGFFVALL